MLPNNRFYPATEMSELYRSAISARLAKLPQLPPGDESDEQGEAVDFVDSLPGGMGPPAMQVHIAATCFWCSCRI
jgi:protein phosphatase methylesterase 1